MEQRMFMLKKLIMCTRSLSTFLTNLKRINRKGKIVKEVNFIYSYFLKIFYEFLDDNDDPDADDQAENGENEIRQRQKQKVCFFFYFYF